LPFRPDDAIRLHAEQKAWLEEKLVEPFDGLTVVATHHAPHRGSLASRFAKDPISGAFVSGLPKKLFEVPVFWVHGHTHDSLDYRLAGCRVVCNPRGCVLGDDSRPENAALNPKLVIEVE
jgi:hypothetical protein